MRGILYKGWFPFSIPRVAEDGNPFSLWDGSTQANDGHGNWLPSKSASSLVTVYGPGSLYCLALSRDQLVEWYWRASSVQMAVATTQYGGVSASGSDTAAVSGPYVETSSTLMWDRASGGSVNEWQNVLGNSQSSSLSKNWDSGYVNGSGGYCFASLTAHVSASANNAVGNVIQIGDVYWVNPGFSAADVYCQGYATNSNGSVYTTNRRYVWSQNSQLGGTVTLDPVSVSLQLSSGLVTGSCFAVRSYQDTNISISGSGSSVSFTAPGSWSLAFTVTGWASYGGVWNSSTGLLTGS